MISFARVVYEVRWWRWFLFGTRPISFKTLYFGPWHLDKESRMKIYNRIHEDHISREPMFQGTYPYRRTTCYYCEATLKGRATSHAANCPWRRLDD